MLYIALSLLLGMRHACSQSTTDGNCIGDSCSFATRLQNLEQDQLLLIQKLSMQSQYLYNQSNKILSLQSYVIDLEIQLLSVASVTTTTTKAQPTPGK